MNPQTTSWRLVESYKNVQWILRQLREDWLSLTRMSNESSDNFVKTGWVLQECTMNPQTTSWRLVESYKNVQWILKQLREDWLSLTRMSNESSDNFVKTGWVLQECPMNPQVWGFIGHFCKTQPVFTKLSEDSLYILVRLNQSSRSCLRILWTFGPLEILVLLDQSKFYQTK
jgi:hypothetical protein